MPSEPGPPPPEAAPLGERPADDELALTVAQARVASRLFGVPAEVVVGRYRLLELVGRGGMGVVWGAWDPELERKVAIKLVDPLRTAARDRIVEEARALAKLSHPNVVPIYDVGVVDDRVYLVMEWVAGENLRVHLHGRRSVREIVDLYLQAARGLAAVHAAGMVHRDFKPENAMMGRDGRVRVLDFGLARADVTDAADPPPPEVAGTPRYMAPEQVAGAPPTPAVDQYALCVALGEALAARDGTGRPADPVRWLDAVVARGAAARPEDRFASIDELIRALGRDPGRVLRRRIAAGAVVAATVAAFAIGRAAEVEPCSGTTADPRLGSATRARIAAHLAALGGFAAAARPDLDRVLDDHQRGWHLAHHAACVAHEHGELTTALYERRLTCLARAEASLAATAEILEHASAATFPDARIAVGALIDPAVCAAVDQSLVPPPAPAIDRAVRAAEVAVERARMFATAHRADATEVATSARTAADATGYAPAIGRALLVEGRAEMALDDDRAGATLEHAMHTALAAHDDVTAVEAFARLAFVVAVHEATAIDGATVLQPIADRLGPAGYFARLLLLNNLAVLRLATSDRPGARALLTTAIAAWRPGRGEDEFELASIPQNLALVVDRPAESLALLARARTEVERALGADHPKVLEIRQIEALFVGDLAEARRLSDDACERLTRLFPHLRDEVDGCAYETGWLADEAGDAAAAAARFAAARFDPAAEPTRAQVAAAAGELLAAGARPAEIAARLERVADGVAATASPWERLAAADADIAAARAFELARQPDAAARRWSAALAILEAGDRPYTARRLARVRTALAHALAGRDPVAAARHAAGALGWYRAVGGYPAAVSELVQLAGTVASPRP